MVNVYLVIAVQSALLLFLQLGEKLLPSNFLARKACHAGSGFLMLYLDSRELVARLWQLATVSLVLQTIHRIELPGLSNSSLLSLLASLRIKPTPLGEW